MDKRWECNACGRIFLMSKPIRKNGACQLCGAPIKCGEWINPRQHTEEEVREDEAYWQDKAD